jgi:hypothetical protein
MDTDQTNNKPSGLRPNRRGERRGGRKAGTPNKVTGSLKEAILLAAEAVGADGKGKDGLLGYLTSLARRHPAIFVPLLGRVLPLQIDQKTEQKAVVHYETLEERRAAMIAKGWSPASVAALEEAMEPKFLRDMREEERMRKENEGKLIEGSPENGGQERGEHE